MRRSERGFALLLVLWTLVPVTILFLSLASLARSDSHLTFNLRDAAKLQAAADGGIRTAIFGLLRSTASIGTLRLKLGEAEVGVRVTSLGGLVNPNIANPALLRALLVRLGAGQAQASQLAAAIVQWRTPRLRRAANSDPAAAYRAAGLDYGPPGGHLQSLGELRDVLGMTPALFQALRPNLSLYPDRPTDPALAPPVVRAALADLGIVPRPGDNGDVFQITAEARAPDGARAVRIATVKLAGASDGRPWQILQWQSAS
jgi:general secretion pathway protein K